LESGEAARDLESLSDKVVLSLETLSKCSGSAAEKIKEIK
jgi:hypothetical protein